MHALLPLAPPQLSQPIGVSADALDAAFLSTGDVPRTTISLAALGAPPGCFGACNNAGECKEGVCKCAATGPEPYDCAQHATSWRPSPPVVAGAAAASQPQPFIYVYDLPPDLGLRKMRKFHGGSDPIYWSEKAFFDRLLADRRVRTLDPEAATLFLCLANRCTFAPLNRTLTRATISCASCRAPCGGALHAHVHAYVCNMVGYTG